MSNEIIELPYTLKLTCDISDTIYLPSSVVDGCIHENLCDERV